MLLTLALTLSTAAPLADQRADLQRFSARLEQRLATVCRPAEPMVFLSGLPETRFVYIDGIGAVFLLPPRALPPAPAATAGKPAPEISVTGAAQAPKVMVLKSGRPTELLDLEARIRETRKEAERMRAQADAAFTDAERQLMAGLRPGVAESMADQMFPMSWTFFLEDAVDDSRTPEQVEKDVTDALLTTILEDSTLLKTLQPADMITVSVDLASRPQPWVRTRPARTVTVRSQKADLDAFTSGKLSKEELLKRVLTKAY